MCNCMTTRDQSYERGALLSNLADVLPYWHDSTSDHVSCSFPLTFMKRNMEAMVLKRETLYRMLQEKLENLFPRLSIRCWQISSNVIGCCSFIYINCFSCFVIFIQCCIFNNEILTEELFHEFKVHCSPVFICWSATGEARRSIESALPLPAISEI